MMCSANVFPLLLLKGLGKLDYGQAKLNHRHAAVCSVPSDMVTKKMDSAISINRVIRKVLV
jgi:hypothetical protein